MIPETLLRAIGGGEYEKWQPEAPAKGFIKIRYYGLLANRCRDERLDLCRRLLLVETVRNALLETPNPDEEPAVPICCPKCGGRRIVCRELPRIEEGGQGVPMGSVDSS